MTMVRIDMEATGKKIKGMIEDKKFKKSWLAYELGVNPMSMYKWFSGEGLPKVENLLALALLLDVRMDDLLVWEKVE